MYIYVYTNCTNRVRLDRVGTKISINRGVRQGDPISPKLFIVILTKCNGILALVKTSNQWK